MSAYLATINLPILPLAEGEFLNAPFTIQELENAVASFLNSKAPGVNGLPIEIYKKYSEGLLPALLNMLNEAFSMGRLPDSMGEAVIIVIVNISFISQNHIDQFFYCLQMLKYLPKYLLID